jgi:arginine decarboxylase
MNATPETLAPQRPSLGQPPIRTIEVTSGVGFGPTKLAAFDAALQSAGVANFNLIIMSSVIPPGATVKPVDEAVTRPDAKWGDRLYVVLAQMRVDQPGQQAWAGIGWAQEHASGKGFFVEHDGHDEGVVRRDLEATLTSICGSRDEVFGRAEYAVHGTVCRDEPACAVVVAVYGSAPWPVPVSEPVISLPEHGRTAGPGGSRASVP